MADKITPPADSSSHVHQVVSPCTCCSSSQIVSLSNMAHHLIFTIKLTPNNYLLWRTQVTLFLEGQNLMGFVDGTHQCPPSTDTNNHARWVKQDNLIKILLIASLSEDVFPMVDGFETSSDIWTALKKAISSSSSSTPQIQQQRPLPGSTLMDTKLYEAVREGELETIEEYKDQMLDQLTPSNNTVLHLTALFPSSPLYVVNKIFHQQSSIFVKSLLTWKNSEGETALHVAARSGRHGIVVALIKHAKYLDEHDIESGDAGDGIAIEMLRMTNNYGDTALHEAVRHENEDIVEVLVKEDPSFQYPSNDMGETPLYLAVETHYNHSHSHSLEDRLHSLEDRLQTLGKPKPACSPQKIVDLILNTCISPAYNGPKNRTALHAAVLRKCRECTEKVLRKMPFLRGEADAFGWTPLHYAALRDFKFAASELLKEHDQLALSREDMDEKKTALHVAAISGSVNVMKEILKHRPDCWEMVTGRGQNILHLVVINRRRSALLFILRNSWARNLINQKDADGNTPLHLYATSKWASGFRLPKQKIANVNAFNKQNNSPLDLLRNSFEGYSAAEDGVRRKLEKRGGIAGARNVVVEENGAYRALEATEIDVSKNDVPVDRRKAWETHLVVATLILTVTFAAGFTIPGGYKDNDGPDHGTAVLIKKAAFKAFIVTDTIAVLCSVIAVTHHLSTLSFADNRRAYKFRFALYFTKISLVAMVIAFATGVYCVISPSSALANTVLTISCWALYKHSGLIVGLVRDMTGRAKYGPISNKIIKNLL